MTRLVLLWLLTATACGSSARHGVLALDLALTDPTPGAADEVRRRVTQVQAVEAVALDEVRVSAMDGGLAVTARVESGDSCAAFDRVRGAVRESLVASPSLALHEVLSAEAELVSLAQALGQVFGDGALGPDSGQPFVIVSDLEGVDVRAKARALSDERRLVVAEYVEHPARERGSPRFHVWALDPVPVMTEREVMSSQIVTLEQGPPTIGVTLNDEGTRRFAALTARLIDQFLAIVVNGEVASVPIVKAPIDGGSFEWSLGRTPAAMAEAERFAAALSAPPIARRVVVVNDASRCPAP